VKFWENRAAAKQCATSIRHEFVIGPLRDSSLFHRKARVYYCIRCKWDFLVCPNRVAVLDERGNPLSGTGRSGRFSMFEEGPCPVFEALISDISCAIESGSNSATEEWK